MVITLKKAILVVDKEVKSVDLDMDKLTGEDFIKAEAEVRAAGDMTPSMVMSMRFHAALAARLIGVPMDDVLAMPATDFTRITNPVAFFLLD